MYFSLDSNRDKDRPWLYTETVANAAKRANLIEEGFLRAQKDQNEKEAEKERVKEEKKVTAIKDGIADRERSVRHFRG